MNRRSRSCRGAAAAIALVLFVAGCAGVPRQPQVLPALSDSFAAPYDAVWDAAVKSAGAVKLRVADKAAGRIETESFTFASTAGGGRGTTQVLWVSMQISVTRSATNRTDVRVDGRVHDALLDGFLPGPTNSPGADFFARLRGQLRT